MALWTTVIRSSFTEISTSTLLAAWGKKIMGLSIHLLVEHSYHAGVDH